MIALHNYKFLVIINSSRWEDLWMMSVEVRKRKILDIKFFIKKDLIYKPEICRLSEIIASLIKFLIPTVKNQSILMEY